MVSISFNITNLSGIPPFLQIVKQVETAISLGYLKDGDQLPTVKEVVSMVNVNPNTVMKAYRELDQRRLTRAVPGVGTFITLENAINNLEEIKNLREHFRDGWLADAVEAQLTKETIQNLIMEEVNISFQDNQNETSSRG